MKTKLLLLGIITVNVVGICALIYNRGKPSLPATATQPSASQPSPAAANSQLAKFEIPPRPTFSTPDSPSAMHAEIANIRSQAFDVAEYSVLRLDAHPASLSLLGKLHLRNGNPDGARQLWNRAIELDADLAEPYLDFGHLELNLGNVDQAEQHFRTAILKDPESPAAYLPLAEVLLAQGKFADAVTPLQQLLVRLPESVDAWCKLGQAYQQLGEFAESVNSYQRALAIDEQSREAMLGLMTAYRSQGDAEKAAGTAKLFAKLDAAQPRVSQDRDVVDRDRVKMQELLAFTVQTAAQLLAQAGDVASALSQLEKAHQSLPESEPIRRQLADMYLSVGNYDQALKLLREPCDLQPDRADAWLDLAMACMKSRRLEAADSALRRVIALLPDSDLAYGLLSQTQMSREPKAAVESARRAVALSPAAGNHYILATALYHAGDMESAKAELKTAVAMEPNNLEFRGALARIE